MTTVQMKTVFSEMVITNHTTEWLKPYSKFANGKEFNDHWEMIMLNVKREFTPLQHRILNRIRKYAWKVAGVANASYASYMSQLKAELGHEISEATIRRTLEKAESFGMLKRFKARRLRNTSQSANVIIFNRYEETSVYTEVAGDVLTDELKARLLQEHEAYQAHDKALKLAHEKKKRELRELQEKKELEAAETKRQEESLKRQTLYTRMRAHLIAKKMDITNINEYAAILYGTIKKAMATDKKLMKDQAEELAWEAFLEMTGKEEHEIKKNRAAVLSSAAKRKFDIFENGYKTHEIARKQGLKSEAIPTWFYNRNQDTERFSKEEEEEARKNLLAKLGR